MNATLGEPALGPIRESQRILTLDALRGFALLGIFMVNIQFFSLPVTYFFDPAHLEGTPFRDVVAWWFVKAFFEYKFISMFSLLFGAGLIMQMTRAAERGQPFVGLYLRRLAVLGLIGLCHGFLIWYGDILFVYSITGTVLLLCRNFRPRTMLIIALALLGFFTVMYLAFMVLLLVLSGTMTPPTPDATPETPAVVAVEDDAKVVDDESADAPAPVETRSEAVGTEDTEAQTLAERFPGLARWFPVLIELEFNLTSSEWAVAETDAYRNGPFRTVEEFRAVTFVFAVAAAVFGYGWHSLAMFFIGGALMKVGFFTTAPSSWRRRLCILGLSIGIPLELTQASIALVVLEIQNDMVGGSLALFISAIHEISSTLTCLGLVGAIALLVDSARMRGVLRALQNVGRLALSNYLLQSAVATCIMYWWGFGLFGEVGRAGQLAIVLAIFFGQIVLSAVWLRFFTIGPVEWLWRSLTYLRIQPMRRRESRS